MMLDVRSYLNIPYSELDCWGLICKVYREQWGIELGDPRGQKADNHGGSWLIAESPRIGDVIVFRESELGRHVALIIDNQYMLHSNEGTGSCVERWNRFMWKDRVVKIYRHRCVPA